MQKFISTFLDKKFAKVYIIVAVVIFVLVFAIYWGSRVSLAPQEDPAQSQGTDIQDEESSSTGNNTSTNTGTTTAPALTYNQALKIYTDKRIQFDENCIASPNYSPFKRGTNIMLDNRSSKLRPIYLDGQLYQLQPYGFKTITLDTAAKLPHTIMIDCGNGKNNARILLQQ